jgi:uncharacterized protein YcbX
MPFLGTVDELWRYPVKSMRGERLKAAVFDASGMVGDRRYAVASSAAPMGKPLLTSRERTRMLLYAPELEPRPTVLTPAGARVPLPSPELLQALQQDLAAPGATLEFEHSPAVPLTDVRPVSFIARSTLDALSHALGSAFDPQRLRSNLILDLADHQPFAEEELTGKHLQFGTDDSAPILRVLERVPRCRMVSLDPETTDTDPHILRYLARHRQGRVAMYASVVQPGTVSVGTLIQLLP